MAKRRSSSIEAIAEQIYNDEKNNQNHLGANIPEKTEETKDNKIIEKKEDKPQDVNTPLKKTSSKKQEYIFQCKITQAKENAIHILIKSGYFPEIKSRQEMIDKLLEITLSKKNIREIIEKGLEV